MKIATFLFGLPCSGKTTFYESAKESFGPHEYINADLIKFEYPDYDESKGSMYATEAIMEAAKRIGDCIQSNSSFVMDAGGINTNYSNNLMELASKNGYHVHVIFIDTPYDICIERNRHRTRQVPEQLILDKEVKKQYKWAWYQKSPWVNETTRMPYFTEKHIFFDMDGVLAAQIGLPQVDGKIDFVNSRYYRYLPVVPQMYDKVLTLVSSQKAKVYILSASPTSFSNQEKLDWLEDNFPFIEKDNIFFVNSGRYKAEMFHDLSKRLKLDKKDMLLVEDTHDIIKSVKRDYKMHSIHVSEFLTRF